MRLDHVPVVYGEEELIARTTHLVATASEIWCAALDVNAWAARRRIAGPASALWLRKLYRPGVLLDPSMAQHLRAVAQSPDTEVRITPDDINETIIIDRRLAILAGDVRGGRRGYGMVSEPAVVDNVVSLFDSAWRSATDLAVYDAQHAELSELAPRVLELLATGCKDEIAARKLALSVRTYRRRVAELMNALGAQSRFQAGARARELGLI